MKNLFNSVIVLLLSFPVFSQTIIYISPNGSGSGLSADQPTNLQTALELAVAEPGEKALRLAQGTYTNSPYSLNFFEVINYEPISISGGWHSDYLSQDEDPSLTILNGAEQNQVMRIFLEGAEISGELNMSNLSITNGYTTLERGGGIQCVGGTVQGDAQIVLSLNNIRFLNNIAANDQSGGALSTGSGFNISECLFDGNSGSSGGAIHSFASPFSQSMQRKISNSVFQDNSNYGNQGSSVYVNAGSLIIEDTQFYGMSDGSLAGNGSSVYSTQGYLKVNRCRFENIRINYWASAVQGWNSNLDIYNSLFLNNKSGVISGYGAVAFYHGNSSDDRLIRIINSTFVGNEGQGLGTLASAVHFRGNGNDEIDIYNSIFWDNGDNAVYKETGIANIASCLSENEALGFVNQGSVINENPNFVNGYQLEPNSPAVDAGNINYLETSWTDLNGGIRLLGDAPDLGAYEYNAAPEGILVNTTQIEENNMEGIEVSTLEALGQTGDTHIFSLAAGDGSNDADNEKFSINESMLLINETANFETQNSYSIHLKATDSEGQEVETAIEIMVVDVNEAPFVIGELPDQDAVVGEMFSLNIDINIFNDEDSGDDLTFSSTLANGDNLPSWLEFNSQTASFSGTPVQAEALNIKVIASDNSGLQADATFTLNIIPLSIDNMVQSKLKVFPVPTSNYLFVTGDFNDGDYMIYNTQGKLVSQGNLTAKTLKLNIKDFQSGIYLLITNSENHRGSSRFVVK